MSFHPGLILFVFLTPIVFLALTIKVGLAKDAVVLHENFSKGDTVTFFLVAKCLKAHAIYLLLDLCSGVATKDPHQLRYRVMAASPACLLTIHEADKCVKVAAFRGP